VFYVHYVFMWDIQTKVLMGLKVLDVFFLIMLPSSCVLRGDLGSTLFALKIDLTKAYDR
jgi:hypothetical protein